ncbi:MAG TPA: cytochrome c oxidase assembly protein [Actinomycetota bacterium]|nr:cytochrome c oxidase assembly protein [Actinomycetota bacterium]
MIFAHGNLPPPPGVPDVLGVWPLEPFVWAAVALVAWWYVRAARRVRSWPRFRLAAFLAGVGTAFIALASPVAVYAGVLFSVHMTQHLLLTLIAAPLLLLGAPGNLALRSASVGARRGLVRVFHSGPARALTHPVVAWSLFAGTMWITHFTGFYDGALENSALHALEHGLYLGVALLFWMPVIGVDPIGVRLSHPVRLGYLIVALPQQSFLGLALWSTSRVIYPHYATLERSWGQSPLDDQRAGALIMWIGGDLVFVAALVAVAIAWMRHDEREAARIDRRLGAPTPHHL